MAIHKVVMGDEDDSYVSEYYEEPAAMATSGSGSGEGRKAWLAIPFCRYMASLAYSKYRIHGQQICTSILTALQSLSFTKTSLTVTQ